MSKNIEIQINTGSNTYEVLYPKTLGSLVSGAVSSATTANSATSATTATKLSTARSMSVNLGSTSSASFDGSTNASLGVSGILPVTNGGTGYSNYNGLANILQNYMSTGVQIYNTAYTGNGSDYQKIILSSPGKPKAMWLGASYTMGNGNENVWFVMELIPEFLIVENNNYTTTSLFCSNYTKTAMGNTLNNICYYNSYYNSINVVGTCNTNSGNYYLVYFY